MCVAGAHSIGVAGLAIGCVLPVVHRRGLNMLSAGHAGPAANAVVSSSMILQYS